MLLVGVDGSPTSLRAAAYAAGLARRQQTRLVAVYVAAPPSPLATQLPDAGALEIEGRTQLADEFELARGGEEEVFIRSGPGPGTPAVHRR